jgi:spectinomycin phosphotransferase/16S rRNA (guanine(1405)-N(7))-methyltransferase
MLAPPKDLTEASLAATLARGWGIEVAGLEYRALGFGSHHWEVVEAGGARWFVTVDELCRRRSTEPETNAQVQARLAAAIGAARTLRNGSTAFDFIVAPVPSLDGAVLLPAGEGFAAAVYPLLEGESFRWGPFRYDDQLAAVVAMLISLHGAALGRAAGAPVEEFRVQRRDELELALTEGVEAADRGPFSLPLAELISRNVPAVRAALHNYDELVANVAPSTPRVLTHGEPHAGNTMLTIDGWKLIDWDTAAFAPPERDLWNLDPGDGSVLSMYADATGHLPRRALLELYRLRSDLDDIALCAADLRTDHVEDANTAMSWETVQGIVQSLSASVERA